MLVLCKMLRLFIKTMIADDKYSLLNRNNLTHSIQILLSRKQNTFLDFSLHFSNIHRNFEHFQKNMTLLVDVFPKLGNPKRVIR